MEETIVTYNTAKLANKLGFKDIIGKFKGKHYYNYKSELNGDVLEELRHRKENTNKYNSIPAPTQSLLSKWLRDEHKIHVGVQLYDLVWFYEIIDIQNNELIIYSNTPYNSHDKAFEIGLFEALEYLEETLK